MLTVVHVWACIDIHYTFTRPPGTLLKLVHLLKIIEIHPGDTNL